MHSQACSIHMQQARMASETDVVGKLPVWIFILSSLHSSQGNTPRPLLRSKSIKDFIATFCILREDFCSVLKAQG